MQLNALGQAIGDPLPQWKKPPVPARVPLGGRYCRLEPLSPERHGPDLWHAASLDTSGGSWTYLPYGPFSSYEDYVGWLTAQANIVDPLFYAIVDSASGKAVGVCAYMRIDAGAGCIEVGHVYFSPLLQRTAAATEAMYLMMRHAFELGYRRYEWKCDSLNKASRRAAQRFGFSFEGVFRQARVVKGRNRDTAWFSVIDGEWPVLRSAYEKWLASDNINASGMQKTSLASLTAPLLFRRDET